MYVCNVCMYICMSVCIWVFLLMLQSSINKCLASPQARCRVLCLPLHLLLRHSAAVARVASQGPRDLRTSSSSNKDWPYHRSGLVCSIAASREFTSYGKNAELLALPRLQVPVSQAHRFDQAHRLKTFRVRHGASLSVLRPSSAS